MPGVDILFARDIGPLLTLEVRDDLKLVVRTFGAANFSVESRVLTESDFSFKFHRPELGDELVRDVIVRIRLHHFEERMADPDGLSQELARALSFELDINHIRNVSLGVEIMLCEIGWGSVSAR